MRFGVILDNSASLSSVTDQLRDLRAHSLDAAWCSQTVGYDTLTLLTALGGRVPDIELMAAVVPTYPRHPIALASQALTAQACVGHRLTLGVGVSHRSIVEGRYGLSYDRPVRHLREYVTALAPLLEGRRVSFRGETLFAATVGPVGTPAPAPRLLVAALGARMLDVAGSLSDGAITWLAGPRTLASHIAPRLVAAAQEADRPAPSLAVGLPLCVTDEPAAARREADRRYAAYARMPAYRAVLDREDVAGPSDVTIVGTEDDVEEQLAALATLGVTDFGAELIGNEEERHRGLTLLARLARPARKEHGDRVTGGAHG
ncbi:TIGR03564 family F420-dependent LLM class oxidoreductase [Streptomyces sp. NPDC050619]|uniref:TIGR03564 family F420-dependent LLM class oxidoreductase n=1 Tax=Streptomyces sp. NPDC050619 TaxID=3157214 RepID=UPI003413F4FF